MKLSLLTGCVCRRCKLCGKLQAQAWGVGHMDWKQRQCGKCWAAKAGRLAMNRLVSALQGLQAAAARQPAADNPASSEAEPSTYLRRTWASRQLIEPLLRSLLLPQQDAQLMVLLAGGGGGRDDQQPDTPRSQTPSNPQQPGQQQQLQQEEELSQADGSHGNAAIPAAQQPAAQSPNIAVAAASEPTTSNDTLPEPPSQEPSLAASLSFAIPPPPVRPKAGSLLRRHSMSAVDLRRPPCAGELMGQLPHVYARDRPSHFTKKPPLNVLEFKRFLLQLKVRRSAQWRSFPALY